jgi:hypothetical protein
MKVTIGRAINLLKSGLSVITIGNSKRPNFSWKTSQTKLLSVEKLTEYGNYTGGIKKKDGTEIEPTNGYGIVTGYGGLEVIDIDLKVFGNIEDGKKFYDEFINFLKDHIDDFDLKFVIYKTVNSGYHIIYKCQEIGGNQKLATLKGHTQAVIETRGIGGYVFIYDNQISKNGYENITEISVDERVILFGICKYFDYKQEQDTSLNKIEKHNEGLTPWDDYNLRTNPIDILKDEFTDVKSLSDRIVLRKNGSKDPHHGYIYKDTKLTYLFTTATIYPHEKALSAFSLYAYKYFNGNFSDAASELYKKGYGERTVKKIEIERPEIKQEELEFPIDVFPDEIQAFLIQNQKTLNHSIDYMGCTLLWCIAIAVGNSAKIEVKTGWRESANIWIGLIGRAGLGKTPSISAISYPLEKKNAFEIKHYMNEYRKWKEYSNLTVKEKKDHEEIKEPVRSQFIVNDVTVEALADLHEDIPLGIAIMKDELNGWLKDMNKYKQGSDLEFWLSCWSNKAANLTRKTAKSSFIESPLMPVLGGIQPGIFGQISTSENKDNGFLDRLLVSFPEKEIENYNRNSINQDVLDWWDSMLCQFFEQMKKNVHTINKFGEIEPRILRLSKDADLEWERVFNNISKMQNSDEVNEYVKSMLSKQKSYVPRFALILTCFWSYYTGCEFDWVSKEVMLKAEKLSNYFIAMSKKIKVNMIETGELRELVKSMKGSTNSEIIKAVNEWNPEFSKNELAEILNISRQAIYKQLKK